MPRRASVRAVFGSERPRFAGKEIQRVFGINGDTFLNVVVGAFADINVWTNGERDCGRSVKVERRYERQSQAGGGEAQEVG